MSCDITILAPDATAIVQDQDGNELARREIPSGASDIIEVQARGADVLYAYNYGALNTGQDVSYATGDDKWVRDNVFNPEIASWPTDRTWVFPVLDPNDPTKLLRGATPEGTNIFGNLERFTDTLGTQIYANDLVIDHLTGLMVTRNTVILGAFNSNLFSDASNYINNGYNNFFVPNNSTHEKLMSSKIDGTVIYKWAVFGSILVQSSTTDTESPSITNVSIQTLRNQLLRVAKKNAYNAFLARKAFTYDPNQDTTKLILS